MSLVSVQKPASAAIVGTDYNALRQDLKANHTHNGVDGSQIDHTNLTSAGTKTHAQIDAELNNIHSAISGGIPWSKMFVARHTLSDLQHMSTHRYRVTFPTPFTRLPIVVITLQFYNINQLDKVSATTPIVQLTTTHFEFEVIHPGLSGGNPGGFTFGIGNGWPPETEAYINYIAMEPPA